MIKRDEFRWLLLIAALTLLARGVFFLADGPHTPQLESRDHWLSIARHLTNGEGYSTYVDVPTAKRGPGGVYFFAALLYLFGDHTLPILVGQWLVEAVTSVLLYLIALEIFDDRRVALTSSLIYAFYGPAIFYSMQALAEPIFTLLLAGFTLSFLRTLRQPSSLGFVISGALLGLSTLTRPITQYYLPVALVVMVWALRGRWKGLVHGLIAITLSFVVVMAPWVIRNSIVFGHFIPASSSSGVPLYQANYKLGEPDFLRPYNYEDANESLIPLLLDRFGPGQGEWGTAASEYEVDQAAQAEALKIIRAHPDRYLVLSMLRIYKLWFHVRDGSLGRDTVLLLGFNLPLLLLAVGAFVFYRGDWVRRAVPVIVFLAYYTAGHMALIAQARNSVPIAPYVILFAVYMIVNVLSRILHTRQTLAQP